MLVPTAWERASRDNFLLAGVELGQIYVGVLAGMYSLPDMVFPVVEIIQVAL